MNTKIGEQNAFMEIKMMGWASKLTITIKSEVTHYKETSTWNELKLKPLIFVNDKLHEEFQGKEVDAGGCSMQRAGANQDMVKQCFDYIAKFIR